MKVAVAYVFPLVQIRKYYPAAFLFSQTYRAFPAGHEHELHILCNGRQMMANEQQLFNGLTDKFFYHDNTGWDIGAFQHFGDLTDADLLVCLGANTHFHREKWLARMVEAFLEHGPGLYGCTAYMTPTAHVRTTSFWCPPMLLKSYPAYIGTSRRSRYEFEHGGTSFTKHVMKLGFPVMMVTWKGFFPFPEWTQDPYNPVINGAPGPTDIVVRDQFIHE